MRADRLISILILLQANKKLTATELSKRLEVSVRTIYRDIDILSGIGVPIFAEKGVNGGIGLLGEYKTSLTGMNKNELLSLLIPTSDKILEDLGVENLKYSAMLKILGNSSPKELTAYENMQNYIYIDMNTWNETNPAVKVDHLALLQNAIWNTKSITIMYRKIDVIKEAVLHPLGLVCKRSIWYLVAVNEELIKSYKVSSIEAVKQLDQPFIRPKDFNLKSYWLSSTQSFKASLPKHPFTYKVNPAILNQIKERPFITILSIMENKGVVYVKINFDAIWQGVEFAFGYGKDIEIIEPEEAITDIKRKALEVIGLYESSPYLFKKDQ